MPCCAVRTAAWERGEGARQTGLVLDCSRAPGPRGSGIRVSTVTHTWRGAGVERAASVVLGVPKVRCLPVEPFWGVWRGKSIRELWIGEVSFEPA